MGKMKIKVHEAQGVTYNPVLKDMYMDESNGTLLAKFEMPSDANACYSYIAAAFYHKDGALAKYKDNLVDCFIVQSYVAVHMDSNASIGAVNDYILEFSKT